MNKSKFLKKSLAMVLAIMMVVAMIPLSASAASLQYVEVNGVKGTVNGDTVTAEVSADKVGSTVLAAEISGGEAAFYGKNDTPITTTNGVSDPVNLETEAAVNGNVYTVTLKITSAADGNDAGAVETYTINITKSTSTVSTDATVARVVADNGELDDMVSYNVGTSKITITMPFGDATAVGNLGIGNFITTDSTTTKVLNGDKLTVTADAGNTKTYTVEIVNEKGFSSFAVEGQTKSTIDATNGKTVTVEAPYGFDTSSAIVTTFAHGDNIKKVTTDVAGELVVKSGDKVTYTGSVNAYAEELYLWISDSVPVKVDVTINVADKNPEAKVTEITVGTGTSASNPTTVSGTEIAVEMPKGYDFAAGAAVNVTVKASKAADYVGVPTQDAAGTGFTEADGVYTGTVDITKKAFTIKIVSGDEKTTAYYNVTLTAAAAAESKITDVTVKGKINNEEHTYTATINETAKTIAIKTPYALRDGTNGIENLALYFTSSVGSTVTPVVGGTAATAITSGNPVDLGTNLPAYDATNFEYAVEASDGTKTTYKVTLTSEAAKTARLVTSASVVGTDNNSAITDDNTYATTVKTSLTVNSAEKQKAIQISVPFSYDPADAWFKSLNLSEGAVAYVKDSGNYNKITALDPDAAGAQGIQALPDVPAANSVAADGSVDVTNPVEVYVISEANSLDSPDVATLYGQGKATLYYVYGVKRAAETGAVLRSVSSVVDTKVTATLSGTTVTITVPYTYGQQGTQFTLNFEVSPQAKFTNDGTGTPVLNPDLGSKDTTPVTKFSLDADGNITADGVALTTATVTSEDTFTTTPITFVGKVSEAKTGAELTGVKVNNSTATISGKNVTVTLPYGGNLNPVTLGLTYSDMATVQVNGAAYDPDAKYDLNNAITIKVTSEDTKTANTYTLTGTVASQFNDVAEDAWYYDYVMQAAAAGWVQGTGNGNFSPNLNVRRGDFSLMVVNMLGADVSSYTTSAFKDVESTHYASAAIAYLADKGVVNGDANGNFNASSYIKRQEAAKIIAGALNLTAPSTYTAYTDDASIANWAKPYVYACQAAGVMTGDTAGTFRPSANIKRSEAAKVIVDGAKVK